MAKVSVPIARSNKLAQVEHGATVGATVGLNLRWADGSLVTVAQLAGRSASGADDGNGGNSFLLWSFLQEVPDPVQALANASGTGLFAITGAGTGALRSLAVSADLTLSNPAGLTGDPTFGLADLADAGGGALVKVARDSKGRIAGTSAATTSDLTEGANLYYTDARADARITAQKGAANGLAPLGSDGKLSTGYLPSAVLGQVSYQGTWDASAGTPPTSMPSKGWYYIVTVAGSTNLDGITDWKVGDWAIYNGAAWNKVDNTDAISTWNGRTGAVVPQAGDYTFAQLGGTPTTLAGYGITDAATAAQGTKADSALQSVVAGTNVSIDATDPRNPIISATGGGGSGDVVGPASAADGGVALFDGTTGKLLKDGGSFDALVRATLTDTSFKNRLINGDFAINQRAFAGGALAAGVYGYDRWKAGTGGCNVSLNATTGVLTHTSGPHVQVLEAPNLAGKTVTVSVEDPSGSITVNIDGVSGAITSGSGRRGVTLAVPSGSTGNVTLTMTATGATYKRVQLEVGGASTEWDMRSPGIETLLCVRYFYFMGTRVYGTQSNANDTFRNWVFLFPSVMRSTPSIVVKTVDSSGVPSVNSTSKAAVALNKDYLNTNTPHYIDSVAADAEL